MSFFKVLSGILLSLFLRPPTIEKLVTITIDEVCATCFQPTVLAPTQLMTASPLVHLKPMRTGTSSFAGGPPLDDSWPSFITTLMSCRLWLIGVYASVRLPNASSFTIPAVDWISWALLFGFVMLLVLCGCCCCYCSENFSLSGSSRAPQLQMKTIVKRIGNLFDKPARQLRTGATIFESFTPCLGEYVGWTWIFVNALAELIWAVLRHPVYREICREIFQLVAIFLFALAIGIKTLVEKTVLLFRDAYLASEPSRIRHACRLEYRQQASLDLSLVEDFSPSCLEASPEVFHLRDKLVRSKSRFTEERSHKVIQEELRVARKLQPSSNLGDQAHRGLSCVRKPPLVKGSAFGRLSVDFSVTRSTTSKVTSLASAPRALARGPAAGGNRDVRNAQWETKQARDRIVTLEAENGRLRGLLAAPGISSDLVMFDPVSQPTPSVLPSFDVPPTFPLDCLPSPSRPAPASAPIKVPTAAPSTNPSAYGTPTGLVPATALAHTIGSNVAASFWAATAAPALASGLSGPAAGPIEPVATAPAALVPAVPSDLVTTPRDLVDLWGPSSFVSPNSNLGNLGEDIHAICIGGGIVHPQVSTNERLRQWHWSPGPISKLLQDRDISDAIDRGPGISMDSQICIGARVRINKSCPMSQPEAYEQVQQQSQERLHPIGTSESRWALETVQAGAQIGQYGIPQFLFGWRKLPGVTIKQKYLSGNNPTLVNDLAQPWGLHVSLCTGVIARVRLQQVLATCIDLFMSQRNPIMLEWEILRDKHKMVEVLQNGDLGEWMGKLPGNYANNARDIIEELLTRLLPTGVDAENKLVVSWMHENSTLECLKIPCKGRNLWAQILSDSADLATIACITPSCLESPCHTNHRCQYLTSKETTSFQHRKSFEFLMSVKPFVLNYDDSTADDNVGTSWTLQMNKSYWIGKMDSMLLADVSNFPTGTPILSVRKSTMALSMYKRLRAKRMLRETNAKGAQHCVIISGGPVV